MAVEGVKLTALAELTTPVGPDWLYIVDVSDTSGGLLPNGTGRKVAAGTLVAALAPAPDLSDYARKDLANLFATSQTINGGLEATGTVTAGAFAGAGWDAAFASLLKDELFDPRSLPGYKFHWDCRYTTYFTDTAGTLPTTTAGAAVQRANGSGATALVKLSDRSAPTLVADNGVLAVRCQSTQGLNYLPVAGNVTGKWWFVVHKENAKTADSRVLNLGEYGAGAELGLITWRNVKHQYRWEGGVDSTNTSQCQCPTSPVGTLHVAGGTWGDPGSGTKLLRLTSNGVTVTETTANVVQGALPEGVTNGYGIGYRGVTANHDYYALYVGDGYLTREQMARMSRYLLRVFDAQNANYRTDPVVLWWGASNLSEVNCSLGASFPTLVNQNSTAYSRDFLAVVPGSDISTLGPVLEGALGRFGSVYDRTGKDLYVLNAGGGNDFRNLPAESTDQLYARWRRAVQSIRQANPNALVFVMPYLPGSGYTASRRTDLNARLHANPDGLFDYVSTLDANPLVGVDGANVAPYFFGDGIHLTDLGMLEVAGHLQPEIEAVLAS